MDERISLRMRAKHEEWKRRKHEAETEMEKLSNLHYYLFGENIW